MICFLAKGSLNENVFFEVRQGCVRNMDDATKPALIWFSYESRFRAKRVESMHEMVEVVFRVEGFYGTT